MSIKAFVFDFGQTLVNSAEGFRTAETRVQKKLFEHLEPKPAWDTFIAVYRSKRRSYKDSVNLSKRHLWEDVLEGFGMHPEDQQLAAWEAEYWETVAAETELFPETEQVLNCLKIQFRLAVISNAQGTANSSKHRITLLPKLKGFFETIIIAGDNHIPPKPDPMAFIACLNQLNLSPDQVVYVGDDWHNDIQGALKAGIKPIWIKHYMVKRNWPEVSTKVRVITSLDELLDPEIIGHCNNE